MKIKREKLKRPAAMKNLLPLLTFLALLVSGCVSNKKFTDMQNQRDQMQNDLATCQQRTQSLQSEVKDLKEKQRNSLSRLESDNNRLQDQLRSAQNTIDELQELRKCPENMTEGIVFKVQIGAFNHTKIPESLDNSVNLDTEKKDGMQKIVLGQFRDYFKADSLENGLRSMGVKEAWIVPYRDGKRVPLKEVIQDVRNYPAEAENES